jgi:hypothetical protein
MLHVLVSGDIHIIILGQELLLQVSTKTMQPTSKASKTAQSIPKLSPETSRNDTMLATISLQVSIKKNRKAHIAPQETLRQLKKK